MLIETGLPSGIISTVWALEDPLVLLRGNQTVGMSLGAVSGVVILPKLSAAVLASNIFADLAALH